MSPGSPVYMPMVILWALYCDCKWLSVFYISVSVHHKSIIYNKPKRCNSGSIVFITRSSADMYVLAQSLNPNHLATTNHFSTITSVHTQSPLLVTTSTHNQGSMTFPKISESPVYVLAQSLNPNHLATTYHFSTIISAHTYTITTVCTITSACHW